MIAFQYKIRSIPLFVKIFFTIKFINFIVQYIIRIACEIRFRKIKDLSGAINLRDNKNNKKRQSRRGRN